MFKHGGLPLGMVLLPFVGNLVSLLHANMVAAYDSGTLTFFGTQRGDLRDEMVPTLTKMGCGNKMTDGGVAEDHLTANGPWGPGALYPDVAGVWSTSTRVSLGSYVADWEKVGSSDHDRLPRERPIGAGRACEPQSPPGGRLPAR